MQRRFQRAQRLSLPLHIQCLQPASRDNTGIQAEEDYFRLIHQNTYADDQWRRQILPCEVLLLLR